MYLQSTDNSHKKLSTGSKQRDEAVHEPGSTQSEQSENYNEAEIAHTSDL